MLIYSLYLIEVALQVIDVQYAIEMIYLVFQDLSEEILSLQADFLTVTVTSFCGNRDGTLDLPSVPGEAEAPLHDLPFA